MRGSAQISDCGRYRYALRRVWDDQLPRLVFVMLNPSTADANTDDPTIRKCVGFAQRWSFGSIAVVNLFAFRCTKPNGLIMQADPIGPMNDVAIKQETENLASSVIVAWGANGWGYPNRIAHVVALLKRALYCITTTNSGQPAHPLLLPYSLVPQPWSINDLVTTPAKS